jgi:hypothetical protein
MFAVSSRLPGRLIRGAVLAATAIILPMQVRAQEAPWQFAVTPYLWVAGISGTTATPASNVTFDRNFNDLFDNLSGFPVMLGGEVRKGRAALALDVIWLKISSDIRTRNLLFNDGSSDLSMFQFSAIGFYRVIDQPRVALDIGGGFRLWSVSTKASLNAGLLPARSSKVDKTFADPLIAARVEFRVVDRWSLAAYADVGGGVGSDMTWQALGTINYRVADWLDIRVGWRYMAVEHSKIDLELNGPIVAATFRF